MNVEFVCPPESNEIIYSMPLEKAVSIPRQGELVKHLGGKDYIVHSVQWYLESNAHYAYNTMGVVVNLTEL